MLRQSLVKAGVEGESGSGARRRGGRVNRTNSRALSVARASISFGARRSGLVQRKERTSDLTRAFKRRSSSLSVMMHAEQGGGSQRFV